MRTPRKSAKLADAALYEYAVRVLSVRTYSTESLKTKLRARALRPADVEAAIQRLQEVGYLDDSRFAESFARYKVEGQGLGKARTFSDLRAQRIPTPLAEAAVEQVYAGTSEAELIEAYIERRLPAFRAGVPVTDQKELAKAWRRLRRAGFSSAAALTALKRRAAEPELLDEPPEEDTDD